MESLEPFVGGTRQWLGRISLLNPEPVRDLLDHDLRIVQRLIEMIRDNDQYFAFDHETVANNLLHVIVLKGFDYIASGTVDKIDHDQSLPEVMQPNVEEIKSHLKSFKAKVDQLEPLVKNLNEKIEEMVSGNSQITEKEKKKFQMMLVDLDTGIKLAEVNEEKTRKALDTFFSEIKSHKEEKWSRSLGNVGLGTIIGTMAGAAVAFVSGPIGWITGAAVSGGAFSGGALAAVYHAYSSYREYEELFTEYKTLRKELEILSLRSEEVKVKKDGIKKKFDNLKEP